MRGLLAGPVIHWRTDRNAVVILRVKLRFRKPLFSGCRATREVGSPGGLPVIRLCDLFAFYGHFMDRAIHEVGQFLGMAERPTRVECSALVSGVRCNGRIPMLDTVQQFAVRDLPR